MDPQVSGPSNGLPTSVPQDQGRLLPGISADILTNRLRALEEARVIEMRPVGSAPLAARDNLTVQGIL